MGNAALVLAILEAVRDRLPVGAGAVRRGLLEVEWPARFQVLPGRPVTVLERGGTIRTPSVPWCPACKP